MIETVLFLLFNPINHRQVGHRPINNERNCEEEGEGGWKEEEAVGEEGVEDNSTNKGNCERVGFGKEEDGEEGEAEKEIQINSIHLKQYFKEEEFKPQQGIRRIWNSFV